MEICLDFNELFSHCNDKEWYEILRGSCRSNKYEHKDAIISFPKYPSESLQKNFVGSSFENALYEAFTYYSYIKDILAREECTLNSHSKICDFGCGWGRYLRYFMKDVAPQNIIAVDIDTNMVSLCRKSGLPGKIEIVEPFGIIPTERNTLDLFFAYSVFSHLSEDAAHHWINEAYKKLKPGGFITATTESFRFIDFCMNLKATPQESGWLQILANAFDNPKELKEAYKKGDFVFMSTGGGDYRDPSFYGEAIISKKYLFRNFSDMFHIIDYNDENFFQSSFIMRKI